MIDTTKAQDILTAVVILMRSHLSELRTAGPRPHTTRAERILEGAIQDLEGERRNLKEQGTHEQSNGL